MLLSEIVTRLEVSAFGEKNALNHNVHIVKCTSKNAKLQEREVGGNLYEF